MINVKNMIGICFLALAAVGYYYTDPERLVEKRHATIAAQGGDATLTNIQSSRTLRCGFVVQAPLFDYDPQSKKMIGTARDAMNALATKAGWSVAYIQLDPSDVFAALNSHRVDAICGITPQSPHELTGALYTAPFVTWGTHKTPVRIGVAFGAHDLVRVLDMLIAVE